MKHGIVPLCAGICVVVGGVFLVQHFELIDSIKAYITGDHALSQLAYVFLLIAVGVFLPFSAMPFIPFASAAFGPFQTALLSIFGWTIGALIAFMLARFYGRSVVEKYVSLSRLDELSALLPAKNRFFAVLIFRLVLPSDMASYALGLTKSLGFVEYFLATLISYTWYSVLLAYLGDAVLSGNHLIAFKIALALLVIFAIGWYVLRRLKR